MKKTLYEILEVSENASDDAIKAAYARLCSLHQNGETSDQLIFIRDAFQILSNPVKRKAYDESRKQKEEPLSEIVIHEESFSSYKLIGILGLVVAIGGWYYTESNREIEKMRQESVARLAKEQRELEEARLEQLRVEQERQHEIRQAQMEQQKLLADQRQRNEDKRYFDQLHRQEEQIARQKQRDEEQRKLREKREAERKEDRERRLAEARIRKDKAELDRIYRETYNIRRSYY
jgi:curved DNA-binding protein CbpA